MSSDVRDDPPTVDPPGPGGDGVTDAPAGRVGPGPIRRAAMIVVVAVVVVLGVPLLAQAIIPGHPARPVAAGTVLPLRGLDGHPAGSFTAPAGWTLVALPSEVKPFSVFSQGNAQVWVTGSDGVTDAGRYAGRVARSLAIQSHVTSTPDGRPAAPAAAAGEGPTPRSRLHDASGRTGELFVVEHGSRAAVVVVLSPPSAPQDADRLAASLAVRL